MFLRFLIARGDCPTGLDYAIPTVARWRLAALPKYLPANDVERLIYSCEPNRPSPGVHGLSGPLWLALPVLGRGLEDSTAESSSARLLQA
jgi:integrase